MGVLSRPIAGFMPLDGATFYAIHENLSPCPLRVGVEGHPSYEECSLRQLHANPLPHVGTDGTFLACPPSSLVVARALIGRVALASNDSTIGGFLHWFALGHKHHFLDVALAESYGWVNWWAFKPTSRKKKAKPVWSDPWPLRSIAEYEGAETGCHPGLLRGKWSPAGSSLNPLPLGGGMLPVPPLTWHAPLARTLGTFPYGMSVPVVQCMIFDFPLGWLQISRRRYLMPLGGL